MLYVFHGADSFRRREALQELKARLGGDGGLENNTTVLQARQTSPQEVMAACDTVPFLSEYRLVIVEGVLESAGRGRGRRPAAEAEADAGPWAALADYVGRMPEKAVLVLLDGKLEGQPALLKALRPRGEERVFSLPSDRELPAWVQQRARRIGLKIEPRAVAKLCELIGSDLWRLAGELDKLAAFAGGDTVREADVLELVSKAREEQGYLLADAIAEGRPAQALRLLHQLHKQGAQPQVLLSTIAGRYRRLAIAREMMQTGATAAAIAGRLDMKPNYALEKLMEQASRHSPAGIARAYDRIVEADAEVKQGLYDEMLSLELLVQELAARGAAA